jgi:hypothetical protein
MHCDWVPCTREATSCDFDIAECDVVRLRGERGARVLRASLAQRGAVVEGARLSAAPRAVAGARGAAAASARRARGERCRSPRWMGDEPWSAAVEAPRAG